MYLDWLFGTGAHQLRYKDPQWDYAATCGSTSRNGSPPPESPPAKTLPRSGTFRPSPGTESMANTPPGLDTIELTQAILAALGLAPKKPSVEEEGRPGPAKRKAASTASSIGSSPCRRQSMSSRGKGKQPICSGPLTAISPLASRINRDLGLVFGTESSLDSLGSSDESAQNNDLGDDAAFFHSGPAKRQKATQGAARIKAILADLHSDDDMSEDDAASVITLSSDAYEPDDTPSGRTSSFSLRITSDCQIWQSDVITSPL